VSAAAGAAAVVGAFVLAGGAGAATPPPNMFITLTGTTGISVSGSTVSGAVNVFSSHTGPGQGSYALVRLNPNLPPAQAIAQGFGAVQAAHGNLDALTATGDALLVAANSGPTIETNLTPGTWLALNTSGRGGPPSFVQFTVAPSASPAPLPPVVGTISSIEFRFRGPSVLHQGTFIRIVNNGFLVHMNDLIGAKSKAAGQQLIKLLRSGVTNPRSKKLRPFMNGRFISLMNPASPGALQQRLVNFGRGWYVEACFMDTQDGREHVQLGMLRLVRVGL
jgi:hypothetical protein